MNPHYVDDAGAVTLYHGDCRDVLAQLEDASVDSVVTDPPYELGFMGRKWDSAGIAYSVDMWGEVLRVLKPGGHLLAFGGTRTWHRMVCAIEDAGFEIRDSLQWLYGSGFPKSLDVSKAIDKAAGAEREVVGVGPNAARRPRPGDGVTMHMPAGDPITIPATPDAERWQGWGTALKPAVEPICLARRPLVGTVAVNVLEHGTGALNIDGCRIGTSDAFGGGAKATSGFVDGYEHDGWSPGSSLGRWPANVLLDESAAALLDQQSGNVPTQATRNNLDRGKMKPWQGPTGGTRTTPGAGESGGASRFFYVAKAPQHERPRLADGTAHPTVKPVDLMRWLVRLVTPPGGLVLDPFAGTGTTAEAALVEGMRCVLIEAEETHLPLIVQRLTKPIQPTLI